MSHIQTYFVAHMARVKLMQEAARPNFALRILVGHASTLDQLTIQMLNLEQERDLLLKNWNLPQTASQHALEDEAKKEELAGADESALKPAEELHNIETRSPI